MAYREIKYKVANKWMYCELYITISFGIEVELKKNGEMEMAEKGYGGFFKKKCLT